MIRNRTQLIEAARTAGLNVIAERTRTILRTGKTARSLGVVVCEDGTIYRSDVHLDLATRMRLADAVKFLKLV